MHNAAQETTKVIFPFGRLNDGYGEFGSANGCFRATTRNVGNWSMAGVPLVEIASVQPTVDHRRQCQVSGDQFELL